MPRPVDCRDPIRFIDLLKHVWVVSNGRTRKGRSGNAPAFAICNQTLDYAGVSIIVKYFHVSPSLPKTVAPHTVGTGSPSQVPSTLPL